MTEQTIIAAPAPSIDVPSVLEAIVRGRCLTATYNRTAIVLAPHILYTRHDELFVDGVVLERDGQSPREAKVGAYKLAGLSGIALTDRGFFRDPLFQPGDPKYQGVTLMAVDPA
ncbi:MAG: hypothetical protein ABIS14_09425 [Sphingomonas sp.]